MYAPHTESGFKAPPNKTLLLFFNGLLAKRGLRRARKQAAAAVPESPDRAAPDRQAEQPGPAEYASLNAVYAVALTGLVRRRRATATRTSARCSAPS